MRPMLASPGVTLRSQIPTGDEWVHEVKWDGMRVLAEVADGAVVLRSRTGRDVTVSWPDVAQVPGGVEDLVVDGELVAFDEAGRPSFTLLQQRIHVGSRSAAARGAARLPVTFMVFDILRLQGRSVTGLSWRERRELLEGLDLSGSGWQLSPTSTDGQELWERTAADGWEGIVSKRVDAPYEEGVRSANWLKYPHRPRTSWVVGGWRPQRGTGDRLAALLLGEMTPQGLVFRGRVGSGIGPKASRRLAEVLAGTEVAESPFVDPLPAADATGARWVQPQLVVDVESLGMTSGKLRQPAYQGIRTDLTPADLGPQDVSVPTRTDAKEAPDAQAGSATRAAPPVTAPVKVEVDGRLLNLTNLMKVLYPDTGFTKGEVLNYYAQVAPAILPALADRAVTRIRWPHGVGDKSFFEKNAPAGTPSWVRVVEVPTSGARGSGVPGVNRFPVVDGLATLTWLVNLSALELHVHQWRVDGSGEVVGPDRLVVDLDPGAPAGLPECARVALLVRAALADRGLDRVVPVTSGSKGMHLYATLPPGADSALASELAHSVADELEKAHPQLVTATMTRSRRGGKVFLDWSQNSRAKTTISPYSLRGTPRPAVATPLLWSEVEAGAEDPLAIDQFTPAQVLERLERLGDLLAAGLADPPVC